MVIVCPTSFQLYLFLFLLISVFFFPVALSPRLMKKLRNGGTHYTIFGYRHRCAKIVSEPKGQPLWTPPRLLVGVRVDGLFDTETRRCGEGRDVRDAFFERESEI
ncbi:MAG: hypothetical protein AB4368_29915 [Xenococcaceae cyanobacterium]